MKPVGVGTLIHMPQNECPDLPPKYPWRAGGSAHGGNIFARGAPSVPGRFNFDSKGCLLKKVNSFRSLQWQHWSTGDPAGGINREDLVALTHVCINFMHVSNIVAAPRFMRAGAFLL